MNNLLSHWYFLEHRDFQLMNKRTRFELRKQAKSSVKQLVMMMIIE